MVNQGAHDVTFGMKFVSITLHFSLASILRKLIEGSSCSRADMGGEGLTGSPAYTMMAPSSAALLTVCR